MLRMVLEPKDVTVGTAKASSGLLTTHKTKEIEK